MQKQLVLWSERSFKPSRTEILFRVKDSYFYYFHSSPIPPYRPALKLWRPKQSKTNPNVEQSILSCMRLNWIDCEFYIYYTLKDRWSLISFKVDSSAPSAILYQHKILCKRWSLPAAFSNPKQNPAGSLYHVIAYLYPLKTVMSLDIN